MRRVVTGRDDGGRSVFVSDEVIEEWPYSRPGRWIGDVWGSDCELQLPADGARPSYRSFFPPATGFRCMLISFEPDGHREEVVVTGALLDPARADHNHFVDDGTGMHWTETVDVGVILEGEIVCELDGGAERRLMKGDVIVQNGTRHAWHNPGRTRCLMFLTVLGARVRE